MEVICMLNHFRIQDAPSRGIAGSHTAANNTHWKSTHEVTQTSTMNLAYALYSEFIFSIL